MQLSNNDVVSNSYAVSISDRVIRIVMMQLSNSEAANSDAIIE